MKNLKKTTFVILLTFLTVLAGCSSDDDNSSGSDDNNSSQGNDVEAHIEFSSGEVMEFKANSVVPMDEPFIYDEQTGHRIMTSGYQIIENDIIYRLSIKAVLKDEPGTYDMYEDSNDHLEALGFYMEFTKTSVDGTGSIYELYRTQYIEDESGQMEITSVTEDRLKGTFSAVLPYMPLEDGKNLEIINGKIDIAILRMDD